MAKPMLATIHSSLSICVARCYRCSKAAVNRFTSVYMMSNWNIERCDWEDDIGRVSPDVKQISTASPLSTHELIGDAFLDNKLVGIYEYMGAKFILFLDERDLDSSQKMYLRLPLLNIAKSQQIHEVVAEIDNVPELVIEMTNVFSVAAHIVEREMHYYTEIYLVHETYFLTREVIYQHGMDNIYLVRSALKADQRIKFEGYPFDFPPISNAWVHWVETDKTITVRYNRRSRDRYLFDGMDNSLFQNRMRSFYQIRSNLANGFRRCLKNAALLISLGEIDWNEDNTIRFEFLCTLEQARWVFENKTLFAGCFDTVRGDLRGPSDFRRECYVAFGEKSSTIQFPQARYLQKTIIDIEQLVPIVGSFYFFHPIDIRKDYHGGAYVSLRRSNPELCLRYDILEGNFVVEAPIEMSNDVLGPVGSTVATVILARKLKEYAKSLHGISLTLERRLSDGTDKAVVLHLEVWYTAATIPKIVVWTRWVKDEFCVELWDDRVKSFAYLYGQCWNLDDIDIVSMKIKNTKTRYRNGLEELGGELPSSAQSEMRRRHNAMMRV